MSRKISEYFKIQPKVDEKVSKSSSIRDCKVVLNDIKIQTGRSELKLFEEVTFDESQNKEPKRNPIKCRICYVKFRMQANLELHMKRKHPEGEVKQFECDFDGNLFKSKGLLYNHMDVHLPLVECQFCNKMLKPRSIKYHLKIFHATDKNFQCKICSKSFKSAQCLKKHEKTHNKVHKCDICNKMYPTLSKLNQHKKENHENGKSFECEICGKKFNQKGTLKNHQKTHNKNRPKPFKCQRCDYVTDSYQYLTKHQEFHERQDEKVAAMKNPIKCEKCPKFLKDKAAFAMHIKIVHPKDIFQCDLCAKFIKYKSSLITHLKTHKKLEN